MVDGGQLVAQDVDTRICFLSQTIDISMFDSASFSVLIEEMGDLEPQDFVDVSYIVDGSSTLLPDWMGLGSSVHTLIGDLPMDADLSLIHI